MGVNGMYGLYGVKGTPVLGVVKDSLSMRLSMTVVWMPGDLSGSAKLRSGSDELDDAADLLRDMPGAAWVPPDDVSEPRRWGAGRGRGWT